jgi:hypothetical protein
VDTSLGERARRGRHVLERPGEANLPRRDRVRHEMAIGQPRAGRHVPIGPERAPPLDLGHSPGALRLDPPGGELQLVDVRRDLLAAEEPQVLRLELVEGRSQRAHGSDAARTGVRAQ